MKKHSLTLFVYSCDLICDVGLVFASVRVWGFGYTEAACLSVFETVRTVLDLSQKTLKLCDEATHYATLTNPLIQGCQKWDIQLLSLLLETAFSYAARYVWIALLSPLITEITIKKNCNFYLSLSSIKFDYYKYVLLCCSLSVFSIVVPKKFANYVVVNFREIWM